MLKSCLLNETHRLNNTNITHYVKRDKSLEEKKKNENWKNESYHQTIIIQKKEKRQRDKNEMKHFKSVTIIRGTKQ